MVFDLEKVDALLNSISLDLMMVSTDNLVEIGDILGKMDPLSGAFAPLGSEWPDRVVASLQEGLKAVIRGQIQDIDRAMALVGDGLSILQDLARALPTGATFKSDIPAWEKTFDALMTLDGLLDPEGESGQLCFTDEAQPGFGEVEKTVAPEAGNFEPETPMAEVFMVTDQSDEAELEFGEDSIATDLSTTVFKSEFIAAVEEIQVLLVAIEQKSDPQAALGELTRHFRTVLGAANLLNLEDIPLLVSNSIGLIEYVVADHVPYSTAVTDILLKACDHILGCLRSLELAPGGCWGCQVPQTAERQEALAGFADVLWMARQGVLPVQVEVEEAHSGGAQPQLKPKKLGEILVEKGLISEGDLGGLIEAQKNARKVTLGDILLAEKYVTQDDLDQALEEQRKNPEKKLGEILVTLGKLDSEQIDQAVRNQEERRETKLGEFLVKSKIGAPEKVAIALREQKQSEGGARSGQISAQTVKVETLKLDGLIDLVGELVIAQSLISSNPLISDLKEQKVNKDLAQVARITSELQRNAMSLRMVQISPTFSKMNRLVRDLANKFDKDVKFETLGGDTEIDRNMVESIFDPLVHLMRNALDHGLESPSERRANGKSPQGLVRLKAYHQGGNVVIELSDDGRGLDKERVLKKAVAQGLIQPGEVLNEAAIHGLVFHPGFSTAETVSDISGRGVGMDVVKKSVEKLRGKIDFTSVPQRGSVMAIRLPLTLAIIDGMIVRVGLHRYILPTISIVESFRPAREDCFTVKHQGEMIRVRNRLIPLIRLDRIVDAHGALSNPEEALVVIVDNEGETRCLLVDEVLGKQEVVIKSLGERLKHIRALAGGTILGDGRVGLILDINGLFEMAGVSGMLSRGGEVAEGAEGDWGMEDGGSSWGAGA